MHDDDEEPSGPFRPSFGAARPGGPGRGGAAGAIRRGGGPSLRLWAFGAIVVLVLLFGAGLLEFWTDVIWYRSVGFDGVFWTRIGAGAGLFLGVTALALLVFLGNLWLARRMAPPLEGVPGTFRDLFERLAEAGLAGQGDRFNPREAQPRAVPVGPEAIPDLTPTASVVLAALSIFGAIVIGAAAATGWQTVLLWLNRVPFEAVDGTIAVDPVFGRDISWFLFDLPFLRAVQSIFNALVVGGLIVAFGRYLAGSPQRGLSFPTSVRVHLAVLAGLFLLSVAFGYQLDKYELVYSERGIATGVSYTDFHAQFFAYDLLTVLSGLAAAFLVGGAFTRWTWPLGATVAAWFLASLVVGRLYPEAVQRLTVDPNKFQQEQPFIANNIAMTRLAYNLFEWEERRYQGDKVLSQAQIDAEAATFANARLWDYRPLGDTLDQLQTVRTYYDFTDVDTDRYVIDDQMRQVMLSARELNLAANSQATGWVNQRIVYTHGIGIAMVPVNEVTAEGQPVLFVKDLPPVSSDGAPAVTEPRIYFGEAPSGYVIVRAQQDEFDFPRGDDDGSGEQQVRTRWTGDTGIDLDTTFSRLLFAFRFRDLDLLISAQVTDDSQLLMHRSLADRLQLIAPFLAYDKDPYVVVRDDGRLVYVQDAFTASDRFPNAEYIDPVATIGASGVRTGPINYIRNSVKVVMDAYDGTMTFYVADPMDPLIRAWQGVFPGLFRSLAELPADLRPHLRVPEDLFNIQTELFGRYHVTDPETFFTENDRWTVPRAQPGAQSLPSEAYYVIMRMPGEPEPEFLLLQPMVPNGRPNMIAWIAARNDPEHYGGIRVYRFPTNTSVFGPVQIEARIDQDPTISAQITLWDQAGSTVVRGNLIVVPVGDTIIYLQPVYLQSTSSRFPEFQRIVVASPTSVVWARTLGEALNELLERGGIPGPSPTPGPTPSPGPTATPGPTPSTDLPTDVAGLIAYANAHFEAAQQALRDGDFARYGEEIELVRQALAQLHELAGPTPTPVP
ncbi:MAG: UPF0182 family protein [Chloroflexota bacterium]